MQFILLTFDLKAAAVFLVKRLQINAAFLSAYTLPEAPSRGKVPACCLCTLN